MSKISLSSLMDEDGVASGVRSGKTVYECQIDNRKYRCVVESVFKDSGESVSDILLRLMKQAVQEKKGV